jgi:uncharacterized protein YqiB (DUF1249 family)
MAPDLNVADEMISTVPRHQDLFLSITERCKYTTMLRLTYQFDSRTRGPLYIADMIEQKWMMNRFLYKWLGYCQHQGHYFHPMQHLKSGNI